jgi:glutathione peroxidase
VCVRARAETHNTLAQGSDTHPLFVFLTTETEFPGPISWNFAKFLIDRQGRVFARFPPKEKPSSPAVVAAIEEALATPKL